MQNAPVTRRDDIVDVIHGVSVHDPYRWLEDGESPEVAEWVAQQNERTNKALVDRPDRGRWHERLVALLQLPVVGGTEVRGNRLIGFERPFGAEQAHLVLRSASDPSVEPQTLLDPAEWSADGATAIDWAQASPSGRLVAYGVSEGGTERSTLKVLDVDSGSHCSDEIPDTRAASVAWMPDESGFFYACYPSGDEYHRHIRFHLLGSQNTDDQVVWDRSPTMESWPDVSLCSDGRYLLIHDMVTWSRFEVHLLDRHTDTWSTVVAGRDGQTFLYVHQGALYGTTTVDSPRGRIITAPTTNPGMENWVTLVAQGDGVRGSMCVAGDEIISTTTVRAVDRIERFALVDGRPIGELDGLGLVSVMGLVCDRSSTSEHPPVFFTTTGFDSPGTLWRWSADDGVQPWSAPGRRGVAGPTPLTATQHRYRSYDGTEVGIFLIHRPDVVPSPETPALLNGYGGFAITETPMWSALINAWCERGGVYAIAGLRGGLEEGDDWHQAGRRANKQNVFDDYHAAGDWLVEQGFTSRARLGINGGSNGGLLVGAALTQRPDAYRAVWCAVPLLDMIRFPQFLIARLWTDEYGDPDVAEEFGWLHAYSPYHHVSDGTRYPAVLLTTAEGDGRVDPLHARKMAALLQHAAADQDKHPVFLRQSSRAGHGAGMPASKRADETADVLTFFSWQLDG